MQEAPRGRASERPQNLSKSHKKTIPEAPPMPTQWLQQQAPSTHPSKQEKPAPPPPPPREYKSTRKKILTIAQIFKL